MAPTIQKYRQDIDGLRGVAIICTVSYHAFPTKVTGGFIGVDLFFVISGFLISGIIFDKLDKGVFSFGEFYARRIRRIFPTMLLVLASLYGMGWNLLPSSTFEQLGKYIAAGAGFAVNFVSWDEVGYFDAAAETKPLLHLWSLGIEEQFYILWPALVVVAWKLRLNLPVLIALIVVASFAANVMIIDTEPSLAFYCMLTRLWELLMGAGLAYANLRRPACFKRYANVQSLLGSIFLAIALVVINAQSQFPGWWALLPISGGLLIMSAGPGAWINRRLLSNRIMVWMGLISYPLYMWHWPLLAYAWVIAGGKPSYGVRSAAVSIAVILSGLTYHLLERNLRFNKHRLVVPGLIVSAVAVFILGMATYGGFIPPKLAALQWETVAKSKVAAQSNVLAMTDEEFVRAREALATSTKDWDFPSGDAVRQVVDGVELYMKRASAKTTLFIGDSHMQQYWPRIDRVLIKHPEYNSALFATMADCPPIPHNAGRYDLPQCTALLAIDKKLVLSDDVDTVVFGAQWSSYMMKYGSGDYWVDPEYSHVSYHVHNGIIGALSAFEKFIGVVAPHTSALNAFEKFIGAVASHKRVFLVLDNPTGWTYLPWYADKQAFLNMTAVKARSEFEKESNGVNIRNSLIEIATRVGAVVIDPLDTSCPQGMCPIFRPDGGIIYKDGNHFTASYCRDYCNFMDITVQPRSGQIQLSVP